MLLSNHSYIEINKYMEWYKLFEEQISKGLGALIGIVIATAIVFFRKLPKYIIEKISESRNVRALAIGSSINDELYTISENSYAMYNHIILYHNGKGNIKKDKEIHMTVKWERIGHTCDGCMSDCSFKGKIPRIKKDWKNQEVSPQWRKLVERTVNLKHELINSNFDDMEDEVKDIWEKAKIFAYKEILIKHKSFGFYTLGLSYCQRFKDVNIPEGIIKKSVNKLKELL